MTRVFMSERSILRPHALEIISLNVAHGGGNFPASSWLYSMIRRMSMKTYRPCRDILVEFIRPRCANLWLSYR